MKIRLLHVFSVLLFLCKLPIAMAAAASDLPNVIGDISIDGVLDEPLWGQALRISLDTETNPGENIAAPVKTVALLMENGKSLLIAFDASDPNPEKIRAFLRDRDSAYNDDFVGVVIDTYNDQRRAFEFFANPLGVQMDLTNDDIAQREDDSWNAIWDAAGKINASGYIVEMEIPLNQLRFPRIDGKQTWGLDVLRMYPRDSRFRLSNNPQNRELNCYLCQFSKIEGLTGVQPERDLEVVPTLTASRQDSREEPATDPLVSGDLEGDVGLTIRWGITPDLTANLAINPDFSQIEADVAQLDVNNQFSLFFPESRPFFLEGADYYRTPVQAVFTRTVADPSVGAKLTGKIGNNTFGGFVTEDEVTNLLIPGTFGSDNTSVNESNTALVGRYQRSFGNKSSLGALVTGRKGDDYHNYVAGIDGHWRITDQHSIKAQVLGSETDYPFGVTDEFEQSDDEFSGTAVNAEYEYDSRNWFAYVRHEQIGAGFRADSGFVTRADFNQQVVGLGHIWHGDDNNWWTRMRLNADWDIAHDDGGRLLEKEIEGYFAINLPLQSFIEFGGLTRDILFDDTLFHEDKISLYAEMKPRGGLSFGVWSRVGDQVDFANGRLGDQIRVQPWIDWNVNQHMFVRIRDSFVKLDSKEGPNIFDAQLQDVRVTWQFSVRSFIRFTLQYQDISRNQDLYIDDVDAEEKDVGRELLYSYKLNPQTVFFLGYSDKHIDDDSIDSLTRTDRSIFMKIGYAWTP